VSTSVSKKNTYLQNKGLDLYRSGKPFFDLITSLINDARYSIQFQTYIFEEDETGILVANALMNAARRGIKVSLVVDGYASQDLSKTFIAKLRSSGIRFRKFEPILKSKYYYFGRRLHHKVIVIDGLKALVSGINISNNYNDFPDHAAWLDWAAFVEGDVAKVLMHLCKQREEIIAYPKISEPDKELEAIHPYKVRIRVNDWVKRKMEITESYLEMFHKAKSHVYLMSPYFLPGSELLKAIIQAADRGVKINLILAGVSDVQVAKHAERYMYRQIFKHNIHIYEYQPKVLHGKLATYDSQWTTVGSYNLNNISAYASIELNLDVENAAFAHDVEQRLLRIISLDCIRLDEEDYIRKMNFFKLFVQRSSYLIFRTLLYLFTFYFKQRE
jgi:cardiolipin synthase A/B